MGVAKGNLSASAIEKLSEAYAAYLKARTQARFFK
jgi:hypothetical protein